MTGPVKITVTNTRPNTDVEFFTDVEFANNLLSAYYYATPSKVSMTSTLSEDTLTKVSTLTFTDSAAFMEFIRDPITKAHNILKDQYNATNQITSTIVRE